MFTNGQDFLPFVEAKTLVSTKLNRSEPNGLNVLKTQSLSIHVTLRQVTDALEVSNLLEIEREIECTPTQQGFLEREKDSSTKSIIRLDLTSGIVRSYEHLSETWHALAQEHDILRTIFIKDETTKPPRFRQRVLKRANQVRIGLLHESQYSDPLHERASLVLEWDNGAPTVYICLRPTLVDRTSLVCLWKDFLTMLGGGASISRLPFSSYSQILNSRNREDSRKFWMQNLENAAPVSLHCVPLERQHVFRTTESSTSTRIRTSDLNSLSSRLALPDSTAAVYTAFGITLAQHCQGSGETIVFTVEGRDRTVEGHDSVVGIADQEYPLKLDLNTGGSVSEAIQQTNSLNVVSSSHAFLGHKEIQSIHPSARCDFKVRISEQGEAPELRDRGFPVTVNVQMGPSVLISAQHDTAIPEDKMRVILDHFKTALASLVTNSTAPLDEVQLISPEEHAFILEMGKPLTEPVQDNVHKLFEYQVEKTPDAPAAQFEQDPPLTYDHLNRVSNQVARQLSSSRGSFVPVCLHRSINLVISLLAILKTGAAYVTLDPETPNERNRFIEKDVGAQFTIVDRLSAGRFANEVIIEDLIENSHLIEDTNLARFCEPSDAVYVIYTSGSTGNPKGVLHRHSSATSGLSAFPTLPNLRQLLFHNPVFSAAQRSVWSTLKQGGCLCLAGKENLTVHIGRTINQMKINVIDVTPSTALLITPGTVPCLRRMTVAGELINPALIPMWVNEVELLNAYGLSENTQVNWRREMVLGQNPQNIGRPSDTTTAFVLIPGSTKLSPLLTPGELCLGGNQLAVHYINRPEKTAEAFIQNPFGPGRLYRTGDMVIAHEDGSIEMVGRIDFQVKINGQRVEPGDSNTIIQTHAAIYTSSVVSAKIEEQRVLVAVVVPKEEPNWPVLRSELKELLKKHIPTYMMPTYWLWEKELPLNINGKVDIPKLAKYVENLGRDHMLRFSSDHYHQPQTNGHSNGHTPGHVDGDLETPIADILTENQATLRQIWATVLSLPVERISPHDNFQSLGGTSLNAIQASSQANRGGLEVSVPDILGLSLSNITPREKHVKAAEISAGIAPFSLLPNNTKFSRDNVEDAFPTTSLQEGFLMDSLMGNSTYVYRRYYRIQGRQLGDILAALEKLSSHHPVLRTTFVANKTSYLQVIRKKVQLSWKNLDMTPQEFSSRPKHIVEFGGNFIDFTALQGDVLAITVHHALLDYWSNSFFVDDLVATVLGQPLVSRPSFAKFIQYTRDQQNDGGLEKFWQESLRDATPSLLGGRAQENNAVRLQINHDLSSFAAMNKVSVGSLIYAAWAIVLSLHTFQQDLVFGITLSGRDVPVEGILEISGPTITTVPFRVQVDPDISVVELAKRMQEDMWNISSRAHYGLRNILRASGQKTTLYDTVVNVLTRENESKLTQTYNILNPSPPYEPNYLNQTMLEAESVSGSLELRLLSSIPSQRASFILGNVAQILSAVLESPLKTIREINPTSEEEEAFLDSLSLTRPVQSDQLAHSLLQQMAVQYPDRLAVQDASGRRLSYAQFQLAVNNLASYLRTRGVKTEDVIPLCLQKSVNTLIAVFGVLKAGASFTPLDPKNPPARNEFIIRDVGAHFAITDSYNISKFASFSGEIINMDQMDLNTRANTAENLALAGFSADNLAYIIYTSGSTGLPKGVQVSHRAVSASTQGMIEACKVDKEWNVLWFLNYVFDASYFDVFTVLGVGGSISVADQDTMINDLATCVNKFNVTQLMVTPTISKLISPEDVPSLRTLLVCGEPITPDVISVWATRMDVYNGYGWLCSQASLMDLYTESNIGPTEATILMTVSKVKPDGSLKSIGYPLKAVKASILHPDSLSPVPWGTVGELCVSGAQVARGYLNRPDVTASAFIGAPGESVLYRTGDYARWLPNGEIECLGRKDNQIKLNGFRIELGEIENVIRSKAEDLIQACAVGVALVLGKKQIVVYYVPMESPILSQEGDEILCQQAIIEPALISERLQTLASYMLPKLFLPFWSFPLLASGKVDRKKLAQFAENLKPGSLARYASTAVLQSVYSSTELSVEEQVLRDAWADLFSIDAETIQLSDLFYNYGGDSIAAINLGNMLRQLNYALSVNDVLTYPSLKAQAEHLKPTVTSQVRSLEFVASESVHRRLQNAGVNPEYVEEIYPCSPGQVEFLTQGHTKDQFWQLMTVRRLPRGFDLERWIDLTTKLTKENQILRAMYLRQDEHDPLSWVQVILKDPILDLTIIQCHTEAEKITRIQAHWDELFKLGKPFVRYLILQYDDGALDLCIKLDHAMYDGTLLRIFDDQFAALREGRSPPQSTPFKDFVAYSQHNGGGRTASFWKRLLKDNYFSFPTQLSAPRVRGSIVSKCEVTVDHYAQSAGVTPSIVFQTAYTILLSQLSKSRDVTYDYLLTGRNVDMDDPQAINGTCANFLPFRSWFDSDTHIYSLLKDTQSLFWEITENGSVSLGEIYSFLGVDRAANAAKTLFLFQPFEPAVGEQDHMRWIVMAMSKVTMYVNYAIMFEVFKDVHGHRLKLQYDDRAFTHDEAQAVMTLYQRIVELMVERGDIAVDGLLY
ncbi:hypothetical protein N7462_003705 [Penicillium macrosclerotiorum]|uniref:uncharacterized protein n=1 Tax=Penicillium macrosclerotiorum TaxID=303699 RepID=UPI002549921B|nr:uncharacterized protein N7462_003705 [Penicillium macrosclerotiorum]KAJ5689313.1 hypothetical protein N7462_003705 [Penicillium macrosclerotiorum]